MGRPACWQRPYLPSTATGILNRPVAGVQTDPATDLFPPEAPAQRTAKGDRTSTAKRTENNPRQVRLNRTTTQLVSIYNASWSTFGGGDKFPIMMAIVLGRTCRVRLLVDNPIFTKENILRYFNLDTQGIEIATVRMRDVRVLLGESDIGIVLSNFIPFGNRATKNVCAIQIPFTPITQRTIAAMALRGNLKQAAKDSLRLRLLADARRSDLVLANSAFVNDALRRNFRISGSVLYPPIEDFREHAHKENIILSVGRIFRGMYNDKRYDVMLAAFKRLCARRPEAPWRYHIVGSSGSDAASVRYLNELKDSADGYPVDFLVNISHEELKRQFNRAVIFWHAAGYDADETTSPERTEHFGMSTVEAMSAGCVPVVINKGGQREIVQHGSSGLVWNSIDELVDHTIRLMENGVLRDQLRTGARERYADFSYDKFADRLLSLFQPLLTRHP